MQAKRLLRVVRTRVLSGVIAAALVGGLLIVPTVDDAEPPPGPIARENQKPGTKAWRSARVDALMSDLADDYGEIEDMLDESRYATPRPGGPDSGGPPSPRASGEPTAPLPVVGYFDRQ